MYSEFAFNPCAYLLCFILSQFRILRRHREKIALRKWSAQVDLDPQTSESDASDSSFFICLMIAELIQAIGSLFAITYAATLIDHICT